MIIRLYSNNSRTNGASSASGFTLLEMLVVLVIMGLLAALVGPQLLGRVDTSRVTAAETQARMIKGALDTMRLDIGRYPTKEEGLSLLDAPPEGRKRGAQVARTIPGRRRSGRPVGQSLSVQPGLQDNRGRLQLRCRRRAWRRGH